MNPLARWLRRPPPQPEKAPDPPPSPARLTYAVGDIHGRADLLDALLDRIASDAGGRAHDLVFLGDYVDRGPDSAGVLHRLLGLHKSQTDDAAVTCLLGNHEYMMMRYILHPDEGMSWLLSGGRETLLSFGIARTLDRGSQKPSMSERLHREASQLFDALGPEMLDWLATRPLWWRSGDLIAVHAHTHPETDMETQPGDILLWARPEKRRRPRTDGTWVVHGHTIVPQPTLRARHVNVDTGAFQGGPLTAGVFAPSEDVRFVSVTGPA